MTRLRVLICGSRNYPDRQAVIGYVRALPDHAIIVSGGARGPDTWARDEAFERGLGSEVYNPDWRSVDDGGDGIRAGFLRNTRMLESGVDRVIAFYDGSSNGTRDTIRKAIRMGLPIEVVRPPGSDGLL